MLHLQIGLKFESNVQICEQLKFAHPDIVAVESFDLIFFNENANFFDYDQDFNMLPKMQEVELFNLYPA